MEIITRNDNHFELVETEYLEFEIESNEEVITEFNITDEQRVLIQAGEAFRYDNELTIGEAEIEALELIEKQINNINKDFECKVKNEIYSKVIKGVKTYYSEDEIKTWDRKVEEAKIVAAGGTSAILLSICPAGVTEQQLAGILLQKSEQIFLIYTRLENEKNLALSLIK